MSGKKSQRKGPAQAIVPLLRSLGTPRDSAKVRERVAKALGALESKKSVSESLLGDLACVRSLLETTGRSRGALPGDASTYLGLVERLAIEPWRPVAELLFERLTAGVPDGELTATPQVVRAAPSSTSVARLLSRRRSMRSWLIEEVRRHPEAWYHSAVAEWVVESGPDDLVALLLDAALTGAEPRKGVGGVDRLIAAAFDAAGSGVSAKRIWERAAESKTALVRAWAVVLSDHGRATREGRRLIETVSSGADGVRLASVISALADEAQSGREIPTARALGALAGMRLETAVMEAFGRQVPRYLTDLLTSLQVRLARGGAGGAHGVLRVLSDDEIHDLLSDSTGRLTLESGRRLAEVIDSIEGGRPSVPTLLAMAANLGLQRYSDLGQAVSFDPLHHEGDGKLLPGEAGTVVRLGWRMASGVIVRRPGVRSSSVT